jgi:hypothetical protein
VGGWATRSTRQRSRRVPLSTRSDSRSPGIFLSPPENSPQHQSVFAVYSYNQDKSLQHLFTVKKLHSFSSVNTSPTTIATELSHPLSTAGHQPTTNHGSIILPDLPRGIQQQVVLLCPSQRRCRPQSLCHMPDDNDDSRYQQR